jgi:hypothetical protein
LADHKTEAGFEEKSGVAQAEGKMKDSELKDSVPSRE